jgi:hypothetical protein
MDDVINIATQGESAPSRQTLRTAFVHDEDLHASVLVRRRYDRQVDRFRCLRLPVLSGGVADLAPLQLRPVREPRSPPLASVAIGPAAPSSS